MQYALLLCQLMVVIFVALHEYPAIRRSTHRERPVRIARVPGLAAVVVVGHLACAYGILRAWWIPYLGAPDPHRAQRYRIRFAGTHALLPERNGMRPDTLHVAFHTLVVAILILLALLTFGRQSA
ncbi:MAG TPA: hypothetical protein VME42_03720 [Steroidobacteraceae bacterium]|nr:hypothetical protein [Steroidobacteraceae bacterium]